jgi:hypothetical protein
MRADIQKWCRESDEGFNDDIADMTYDQETGKVNIEWNRIPGLLHEHDRLKVLSLLALLVQSTNTDAAPRASRNLRCQSSRRSNESGEAMFFFTNFFTILGTA